MDVRDVARAHLKAVLVPEAAGKRFILSGGECWHREICEALKARYPNLKVPSEEEAEETPDFGNQGRGADNTRSKEILGIQYHSLADTVCDAALGLVKRGAVKLE